MNLKCFAVFDSKAGAYMRPFFDVSAGSAVRGFEDEVNNPDSMLSRHPGDFTLFELGTWDDSNAQFKQQDAPLCLGVAVEFIQE